MKDIPIIINNRDRVTPLCELVTWLLDHGYRNLYVLDNDSKYPPLLEYYQAIEGLVKVISMGRNLLAKALWVWPGARKFIKGPFVYTDSDIVPVEYCPDDLVGFLIEVAEAHGMPNKVGMGLKIDDLPDCYAAINDVRIWESQHWDRPLGFVRDVQIWTGGVDSTFAYYPEFRPFSVDGIRTGEPYVARHTDWYVDSSNPTEEQQFYENRASRGCHNWGIKECYSQAVKNKSRQEEKNESQALV